MKKGSLLNFDMIKDIYLNIKIVNFEWLRSNIFELADQNKTKIWIQTISKTVEQNLMKLGMNV